MSEATQRRLAEIAEQLSTPRRRVSPMQVAAQLLEEAVRCVPAKTERVKETEGELSEPTAQETPDPSEESAAENGPTVKQGKPGCKQRRARGSKPRNKT